MKNKQKWFSLMKTTGRPNGWFRLSPVIAAMGAIGFATSALAVDRTWFGGTSDWGVSTNWAPNGVPGSSDRAIIGGGNANLSFDSSVGGLDLSNGSITGAGDLAVSGATTWTSGPLEDMEAMSLSMGT